MMSALQKRELRNATSATQLSENCSATSVFACGMFQGWGFRGVECWYLLWDSGKHPCPSFLFGEMQAKAQNIKDFCPYRTPQILGKEEKNAKKGKLRARKKQGSPKTRLVLFNSGHRAQTPEKETLTPGQKRMYIFFVSRIHFSGLTGISRIAQRRQTYPNPFSRAKTETKNSNHFFPETKATFSLETGRKKGNWNQKLKPWFWFWPWPGYRVFWHSLNSLFGFDRNLPYCTTGRYAVEVQNFQ